MRDGKMPLEDIAAATGLTRERVRQILDKPPQNPGRPRTPARAERLRKKLAYWEARRSRWAAQGRDTSLPEERIAVISAELARPPRSSSGSAIAPDV